MEKFDECIIKSFKYVSDLGIEGKKKDENSFIYANDEFSLEIIFDPISYEISSLFSLINDEIEVTLQDILDYIGNNKVRGIYQIGLLDQIEVGVSYISNVIKETISLIIRNDGAILKEVYEFHTQRTRKMRKDYYVQVDMAKAEKLWKSKEYLQAKQIYEKHFNILSKMQLKRLEYICKHCK